MSRCNLKTLISRAIIFIISTCTVPYFVSGQSTITGNVWFDQNANGIADISESPVAGLPVFLITCSGQFIASTLTDDDGAYGFEVTDGNSYKIFFNKSGLPGNYAFTLQNQDTDNDALSNGYTNCISPDEDNYILNGGLTILANIGDKIWEDTNGSGLQDPFEPGIQNIMVFLHSAIDGTIIAQAISNQNGTYGFTNIFPGTYYIRLSQTGSFQPTVNDAYLPALNSDITQTFGPLTSDAFDVEAGENYPDIDAGLFICATISGTIYYDNNFNDNFDSGENGINELQVKLWQITDSDTIVYDQTYTKPKPGSPSDDGYYRFCVPPGRYFVQVEVNPNVNLVAGLPFVGGNPFIFNYIDHSNGINTTNYFDVVSGDSIYYINNGFYCTGSVNSLVWMDNNNNGIRDAGENGIADVTVYLYNSNYQVVAGCITDSDGICNFPLLKNGQYFLYCIISPDLTFTLPHVGNEETDSDIDGSFGSGTTSMLNVNDCQQFDHIDIGLALRPLPVTWVDLVAYRKNNTSIVSWNVESELNTSHYQVMRNVGVSEKWVQIEKVGALNRTSGHQYTIEDRLESFTSAHYKIISVDFDGRVSESKTVYLSNESNTYQFNITPNPASEYVSLEIYNAKTFNTLNVSIINSTGQVVASLPVMIDGKVLVAVSKFVPGLYHCILRGDGIVLETKTMIIQK